MIGAHADSALGRRRVARKMVEILRILRILKNETSKILRLESPRSEDSFWHKQKILIVICRGKKKGKKTGRDAEAEAEPEELETREPKK